MMRWCGGCQQDRVVSSTVMTKEKVKRITIIKCTACGGALEIDIVDLSDKPTKH